MIKSSIYLLFALLMTYMFCHAKNFSDFEKTIIYLLCWIGMWIQDIGSSGDEY